MGPQATSRSSARSSSRRALPRAQRRSGWPPQRFRPGWWCSTDSRCGSRCQTRTDACTSDARWSLKRRSSWRSLRRRTGSARRGGSSPVCPACNNRCRRYSRGVGRGRGYRPAFRAEARRRPRRPSPTGSSASHSPQPCSIPPEKRGRRSGRQADCNRRLLYKHRQPGVCKQSRRPAAAPSETARRQLPARSRRDGN